MYEYRARLSPSRPRRPAIYDGDTLRITADLGFGIWADLGPCRMLGINAPEVRGATREAGLVSRDWLRTKMAGAETFTIRTFQDKRGKYGRWLVVITLDGETESVNQQMVNAGHAVVY